MKVNKTYYFVIHGLLFWKYDRYENMILLYVDIFSMIRSIEWCIFWELCMKAFYNIILFHVHHLFCSWPPINCSTPKLSRSPPSRTIWVSKCYMVVKGNFNIKKMNSVILFLFSSLFPILLRLIFSIQFFILPCNLEAEWPIMIKKIVFNSIIFTFHCYIFMT